ncbi:hypothetical protein [Streptomyces decoyicus]|uniref:hypothetical protein n=1 Tax=Streptomyces decoyicus TaxID=249567 RepID=UPI00386C9046
MTRRQLTDDQWKFIEPYLPIGAASLEPVLEQPTAFSAPSVPAGACHRPARIRRFARLHPLNWT